MKKYRLGVICIVLLTNITMIHADVISTSFSIYPIDVTTTIDTHRTVSYTLTNITSTPVIIHVKPDFLRVGAPGEVAQSPFMDDQIIGEFGDRQFALQDVRVSEPYVIVRPRQNKIVRVSFSIPPDAEPGTYRANILFTPELNKNNWNHNSTDSDNLGINIQYVLAQEISIYANKGSGSAESAGVTCQFDKPSGHFILQITNATNWVFNPTVSIYSEGHSAALNLNKIIPVMPQTEAQRAITVLVKQTKSPLYIIWKLPNSGGHKVNCS